MSDDGESNFVSEVYQLQRTASSRTRAEALAFVRVRVGVTPLRAGLELVGSGRRKKIATENVTMVPKQIHQGNSITGSQLGCVYNLPPKRPAMLFGRPLKIATTMKPTIIAMMFPKSLPRAW